MTYKDYEMLAYTLRAKRVPSYRTGKWLYWVGICEDVADTLAAENPKFDKDKFLKACGINS